MGSIFGKSSEHHGSKQKPSSPNSNITEKDKAVLDLKNSRDKLKKYKKKLESESLKLHEQAKLLLKADQKSRALLVLKLKKHKEAAVDSIEKQLLQVFELIDTIEWESTNIQVLSALKEGTAALNKLHEEMSVDDVEELLNETKEAIETENRINSIIAGQSEVLDDDELQLELDSLISGALPSPKEAESKLDLPAVPTHAIQLPETSSPSSVERTRELVPS